MPSLFGSTLKLAQAQNIDKHSQLSADQIFREGWAHYQQNQFEEALNSFQQARRLYQHNQNHHAESTILSMMATIYIEKGNYSETIRLLAPALHLVQVSQDAALQISILGNLGIAYKGLGQYLEAIDVYKQAFEKIELLPEDQRDDTRAQLLDLLGNIYNALGDYQQAITSHLESVTIAQESGNVAAEISARGNLGAAYSKTGNNDLALQNYQISLQLAQDDDDSARVAYALNNIGTIYHGQGDFQNALENYEKSLVIIQTMMLPELEIDVLSNLGLIYEELESYEKAITYYEQSLAKAKVFQNPQATAMALNNLGHGLFNSGRLTEAETQLRAAISYLEPLRSTLNDTYNVSLFDTQIFTYNLLQQTLVTQEKHEAALEISEAGRARALADLLKSRIPSTETAPLEDATAKTLLIDDIRKIARDQNATLVEYTLVPEDAFRVQGRQRGNTSELYIWVVQPNGNVDFYSQPLDTQRLQLKDLVSQMRNSLGRSQSLDRGFISVEPTKPLETTEKLKELYQILIEPIENLLPDDSEQKVIFIPHEELFLVPFPALINGENGDEDYLIKHHTILTAPSIQTLEFTREQKETLSSSAVPTRQEPLIIGNPEMPEVWNPNIEDKVQLSSLPGAEREALAIADFFGVEALTGSAASEKNIKDHISNANIVHLASHGLLEYGNPTDTGISDSPGAVALAPTANEQDGLLTSSEILNDLTLTAELVVLSACDTGRGEITGDGVIGLARSFIASGTPSVLVSLWAVPDAPTTDLMIKFYQELGQGNDKSQALRQAMLTTMEEHSEPKNWAAFTLIGESQ